MNSLRPVAVDLFGGVGGMSLGFDQAGFDVVCAVEFDRAHAAAHRFNFPRCEVLETDARRLSVAELRRGVAKGLRAFERDDRNVDVVFGGPPCQGFSVGGILDPTDTRNELVEEFARLVAGLRPKAFVLENVPAMATRRLPGADEPVPTWLAKRLAPAGYELADPVILNSASFGVPQDRRRVVIVGVRSGHELPTAPPATHRPRQKRPHPDSDQGLNHEEAALPLGPSVMEAIGDLPNLDDFDELLLTDAVAIPKQVRPVVRASASPYARGLAGFDALPDDLSWRRPNSPSRLTSSLRTTHGEDVIARFHSVAPGDTEPVSRFYRLHPDGISPTLRAGSTPDRGSYSAPRPIHPEFDRVISVREAARLHGFPDWFRFTRAKWHGFRQVGNSMCPPLARAVGDSLRVALGLEIARPSGRLQLGDESLLDVSSGAGRRSGGRRGGARSGRGLPETANHRRRHGIAGGRQD
jgi:DNA (cytosine-5)-methyltransferase 1